MIRFIVLTTLSHHFEGNDFSSKYIDNILLKNYFFLYPKRNIPPPIAITTTPASGDHAKV